MASSSWTIEGSLTKNLKEGNSKTGRPWLLRTVSVYAGKNKETEESKYEYVSFFVKPEDVDFFRDLPAKTKLRLYGKPQSNAYIKDGQVVQGLQLSPAWENWYEIVERAEEAPASEYEESDEPF